MSWEDKKIETKTGRPLKRGNWTNEEIVKILEGCTTYKGTISDDMDNALDYFKYHFSCNPKEFGAMAYDPDTNMIIHIGDIPEQMKIQTKRKKDEK